MLIYNIDLAQAENRIVAYIAPEPLLIRAFENGEDIHRQTAGLLFNKSPENVTTEDGTCPLGNGEHSERFYGKKANHGLNYGIGVDRFALECGISNKEAEYIIGMYHRSYPGIRKYHAWVREELRRSRTLTNPFGRKRLFQNRLEKVDRYTNTMESAYNFIPQSTVADVVNRWGLNYLYYNQDKFSHVELLLQVHDSIVIQIPTRDQPWQVEHTRILLDLKKSLEQPITWRGRTFSIPIEIGVGRNFGELFPVEGLNESDLFDNNVNRLTDATANFSINDKEERND